MTKNLKILLPVILLIQLLVAALMGLAHDEAYYWLFSHNLDWGYFDHPPMVAIIIRLFSFLPHSTLALRLGFILMQFGALMLLWKLIPQEKRWYSTLLFFAFPLASFSGLLALPDMPLLFMSALYCYFLQDYLRRQTLSNSVVLGLTIAFLLYSKYHGILLVFFTLLALPKLFKQKHFYLVALVAILFFLPHVWWQYSHQFATIKYHFIERPSSGFSFKRSLEYVVLQVFMAGVLFGPLLWFKIARNNSKSEFDRAMKFISFGVILFFLISTFSKKFEANWTVFLTVSLIYLAASSALYEEKWFKPLLYLSFSIVMLSRFLLVLPANMVPIKRLNEFHGWKEFAFTIRAKCQGPILANTYQIASKLSYYLQEPVHALNYHSRKNQFDFWIPHESYYLSTKLCYLTDKRQFGGEEVLTPEGKKLHLIKDFSPAELTDLTSESK
jgi:4-amino-4-deoxy-L-arabinose transferase-like glycosyltransferase